MKKKILHVALACSALTAPYVSAAINITGYVFNMGTSFSSDGAAVNKAIAYSVTNYTGITTTNTNSNLRAAFTLGHGTHYTKQFFVVTNNGTSDSRTIKLNQFPDIGNRTTPARNRNTDVNKVAVAGVVAAKMANYGYTNNIVKLCLTGYNGAALSTAQSSSAAINYNSVGNLIKKNCHGRYGNKVTVEYFHQSASTLDLTSVYFMPHIEDYANDELAHLDLYAYDYTSSNPYNLVAAIDLGAQLGRDAYHTEKFYISNKPASILDSRTLAISSVPVTTSKFNKAKIAVMVAIKLGNEGYTNTEIKSCFTGYDGSALSASNTELNANLMARANDIVENCAD